VILYFGQLYLEARALAAKTTAFIRTVESLSPPPSSSSSSSSSTASAINTTPSRKPVGKKPGFDDDDEDDDKDNEEDQVALRKELEEKKGELVKEAEGIVLNTIVNAAYLPLTIHWSVEKSLFPEWGVGVCGTVAAVAQIVAAWKSL
jgi:hypothetical protein